MATAGADSVGPGTGPGSTIATVETDTGRLVERRPLAYLVVWGARNERRPVSSPSLVPWPSWHHATGRSAGVRLLGASGARTLGRGALTWPLQTAS